MSADSGLKSGLPPKAIPYPFDTRPSIASFIGDVMVTGVEESEGEEGVRMYVGPRYNWMFVRVTDPDQISHLQSRWGCGQHVLASHATVQALGPVFCDEAGKASV